MIKQSIPFDSKTIQEEEAFRQPKRQEQFLVKVNGFTCDKITRRVTAHETRISYSGGNYPIHGTGYDRFISLTPLGN